MIKKNASSIHVHPRILHRGRKRGFYDVGVWGHYGQWGHKEYLGQPLEEAPKFQLLLDAFDEFKTLRSIRNPQGRVPQFDTPPDLPRAETGIAYQQT